MGNIFAQGFLLSIIFPETTGSVISENCSYFCRLWCDMAGRYLRRAVMPASNSMQLFSCTPALEAQRARHQERPRGSFHTEQNRTTQKLFAMLHARAVWSLTSDCRDEIMNFWQFDQTNFNQNDFDYFPLFSFWDLGANNEFLFSVVVVTPRWLEPTKQLFMRFLCLSEMLIWTVAIFARQLFVQNRLTYCHQQKTKDLSQTIQF